METQANYLTILHFNDVYNIEEKKTEPVGGVARFKTALDSFKDLNPLVLFSGDLFQPSLLSAAYDGEQMLKPINSLNVDVACYGNHDFDLGVETLTKYSKQCNFPWLLSNVKAKLDNQTLANSKETFILHKNGLKIGFMGLAEKEWVFEETVLEEDDLNYENYVTCAQRLTKYLREDEKCDFIIALTHMRNKNDRKLAAEFNGIDLILGGHDHVNIQERVNGTYVIKSGSDFVEFNKIVLKLADTQSLENKKEEIYKEKFLVDIETIHVTKAYEPNSELENHVKEYLVKFEEKMKEPVFHSSVQLETSFSLVRSSEQNFSNFFADLVRLDSGCDCALVNTGTFRSNRCFSPGVFTLGDIRLVLPWEDSVVKLRLTGEEFWKTLENSVSTYPVTDGRFLAVSGVSFTFYPNREPGNRVPLDSILVKGQPLSLTEFYTIATKPYMRAGKDGYVILKGVECFAEESEDVHLTLKKFFLLAKDPNIVELWAKSSGNITDEVKHHDSIEKDKLHLYEKLKSLIHDIVLVDQEYFVSIAPKIEGRITMITEN